MAGNYPYALLVQTKCGIDRPTKASLPFSPTNEGWTNVAFTAHL
jgi:hypothetical protein